MTDLSAIKRTRVYDGIIDVFSGHFCLVSQMLNMDHTKNTLNKKRLVMDKIRFLIVHLTSTAFVCYTRIYISRDSVFH